MTSIDFPTIWNVPFLRNPFFLGRDELLIRLYTSLRQTQRQALIGLDGVGKTQLAIEYVYRHLSEYQAVLWACADSTDHLRASYTEIAQMLHLKDEQEQSLVIEATRNWLQTHQDWLLILDSADEPDLIIPFLPDVISGHVLITTCVTDLHSLGIASPLRVETLAEDLGALFLLRRAGMLPPDAEFSQAGEQDQILALQITQELGCFPLALDQAGGCLEATGMGLDVYQEVYQQHRADLLKERWGSEQNHPESVATTWLRSFQRIEARSAAAAELLCLCAFLGPSAIGEELLLQGGGVLGPTLSDVLADRTLLEQAILVLQAYSFIARDTVQKTLIVHRLVQFVIRDNLSRTVQRKWMERAISLLSAAFPKVQFEAWAACERCLPHALQCAQWVEDERIVSQDVVRLLNRVGYYLTARAQYKDAALVLQQARTIAESELGERHPDTATNLNIVGYLYECQGKYVEAELMYQRALSIREQELGEVHFSTATSLSNLALLYVRQGKYEDAELLLQRALAIREKQLGEVHPRTATSLNNLAYLYRCQGEYERAESLYIRALDLREQQCGPVHPDTASSLNNLAVLYEKQSRCFEAEMLLQRALVIREEQLGEMHPDTATTFHNLASVYERQGRHVEAGQFYQRALSIRERLLGHAHPDVQNTREQLAALVLHMKPDYSEEE